MYDPWDDHEATGLLDTEKHLSRREQARWPLYAAIYLFILLFTNFLTGSVFSRSCETCTAETNDDPTSPDRPLYKDLHRTSLHFVNFSAFSLTPSQYTAPASTEVDEAWRTLGVEYRPFLIPVPQAPVFSISTEHVIVPAEAPGARGQAGYVADMDGLHQLHCLNLLRKSLFFNYEYYSSHSHPSHPGGTGEFREFSDPPLHLRAHINHCVDALRERIMCAADSEVLPYYWRDRQGFTIPDFAVTRQCRSFESLRRWAEEHQLEDWGWEYRLTTPEDAFLAPDPADV